MVVTPKLLSAFPLLKPLSNDVLVELAPQAELVRFTRRGVVLTAGVREDRVGFLFEGRLQGVDFTIDGREVGLYFIEPGDYCGELGLFDRGTQPEFVIALTAAMVVYVPAEALRGIMVKDAQMVNSLSAKLVKRVRQLTYQRSLLALPNIGQRVCCQLWLLIPEPDKSGQAATSISNPPTHMEIASMLNLSRETVTRVFQLLQSRQIISRAGAASLLINDLMTLKQLADGSEEL